MLAIKTEERNQATFYKYQLRSIITAERNTVTNFQNYLIESDKT
jgi:hypothetical protein